MVSFVIGVWIQSKNAILGRCHVYQYLNESLTVPPTIWRYTLGGGIYWLLISVQRKRDLGGKRLWNCALRIPFHLYFTSIFLNWYLGFEPTLQLTGCNLRALQNKTLLKISILNTVRGVWQILESFWLCNSVPIEGHMYGSPKNGRDRGIDIVA